MSDEKETSGVQRDGWSNWGDHPWIITIIIIIAFIGVCITFIGVSINLFQYLNITKEDVISYFVKQPRIAKEEKVYFTKINSKLDKQLKFKVTTSEQLDDEADIFKYKNIKIEIFQESADRPYQVIEEELAIGEFNYREDSPDIFILEDVNFDGYIDFRFLSGLSACCESYNIYINTSDGKFQSDKQLTNIFSSTEMIEIFPKQKEIHKYPHCTPRTNTFEVVYSLDKAGTFNHVWSFVEIKGKKYRISPNIDCESLPSELPDKEYDPNAPESDECPY